MTDDTRAANAPATDLHPPSSPPADAVVSADAAPTGDTFDGLAAAARIVTIGTFDGLHLGHRHLLRRTVAQGRSRALATLAVTFEPPPAAVLRPDRFPGRLCTAAEKLAGLAASGVDDVLVVRFTSSLAGWTPERFMIWLVEGTGLRELWIGEAFALGKDRGGDVARLTEIGGDLGFGVTAVSRLALDGRIVSSSAIRGAVQGGDVGVARRLLGRPFRIAGEVIHGAHLGRTIGFPTANVVPSPDLVPLADGIYASHALLPTDQRRRPAMTYVGTRPTVNTGARLVETHLLDFDGDLYGQILTVDLLERLRPDEAFESLEEMVDQLRRDEANAREVLARLDGGPSSPPDGGQAPDLPARATG